MGNYFVLDLARKQHINCVYHSKDIVYLYIDGYQTIKLKRGQQPELRKPPHGACVFRPQYLRIQEYFDKYNM